MPFERLVGMTTSRQRRSVPGPALLLAALLFWSGCGRETQQPAFEPLQTALDRTRPPASLAAPVDRDDWTQIRRSDPEYLSRNSIELVRVAGSTAEPIDPGSVDWSGPLEDGLRFRQKSGATNALPADRLFSRVSRALSHGCVRVERPVTLAHALLADAGWSEERIEADRRAMHRNEEQWVRLEQPVPVHLMYFTAWVDESGRAQFRRDIYGHDARQGAVLDRLARRAKPVEQS